MMQNETSTADDSSCSSHCTEAAFLDMLGLSFDDVPSMSLDIDGDQKEPGKISDVHDNDSMDRSNEPPNQPIHSIILENNSSVIRRHLQPSVTRVEVPSRCSRYLHKPSSVAFFVIDNFLQAAECQGLIQLAHKLSSNGFHYVTEAAHTDNDGISHIVKLQEPNRHKLSVFEHPPSINRLWERLKPIVLQHIHQFTNHTKCGPPLGLNPRLRVLRYDASDNDIFEPHFDATTRVTTDVNGDQCDMTSLLTVLVYLNDGGGKNFNGGETFYLDSVSPKHRDGEISIVPSCGKAVVFEHDLYHTSVPLGFGTKYVLRTDVLFDTNTLRSGGVDVPRDWGVGNTEEMKSVSTLSELCHIVSLANEEMALLEDAGLLDLTFDTFFSPGVTAVKSVLSDILRSDTAEMLLIAALKYRQ
ncbi:hypothetical protein ACHAXS_007894 [Conticribra weissflogii]